MEVETSFFRVNIEDFNHFKLISFIIKKEKPTEEEWNNFITHTKMFYRDMAEKYVLICELSELGFIWLLLCTGWNHTQSERRNFRNL